MNFVKGIIKSNMAWKEGSFHFSADTVLIYFSRQQWYTMSFVAPDAEHIVG